jgi:phosphatidate phosphatase APP1
MAGFKDALHELGVKTEDAFDSLKQRMLRKKGFDEPVRIMPYRGFGTPERIWLEGRVLEQEYDPAEADETIWHNMVRTFYRYESDEVAGARVRAAFGALEQELSTGDEGYFELDLELSDGAELERGKLWHPVELELLEPESHGGDPEVRGHVQVPSEGAELLVVSDIDDTVVRTGATNRLRMARVIFLNNHRTRMPFPGIGAFYRALQVGSGAAEGGEPLNPIFYVSSSPWNLYDLFEDFMEFHDIPRGPIFLKDFGLDDGKVFKSGHEEHKVDRIRRLAETYPDLRFLLIGDSGQHDPEIYHRAVLDDPDRFLAVYLRDVTPDDRDRRDGEVHALAAEVEEAGVPMLLVEDTLEAARHAAENGWIAEDALEAIEDDRDRDEDESSDGLLSKWLG